jgi:hypothetical protein
MLRCRSVELLPSRQFPNWLAEQNLSLTKRFGHVRQEHDEDFPINYPA